MDESRGGRRFGRPRRPRKSVGTNTKRIVFAVAALLIIAIALSLRPIATFWTDYLWFDNLGMSSVWSGILSARVGLSVVTGLVFFVCMFVNLLIADRLAPRFPVDLSASDEVLVRYRELVSGRRRLVWFIFSALIASVPAVSAESHWESWLLFWNGGSFGIDDQHFGQDIGFFMFKLPFLSMAVDWLLGFLLLTIIVVAVVHYLNGSIRVGPVDRHVSLNAKAHLSILLALAAFTKAGDYWLERSRLVLSRGSAFDGAGYTDVHASLPAIQLMILISVFAGVILLLNIRRHGWSIPVITVGLWALLALVTGGIYPAFVQRFQVSPAELSKERPFVERNITATREALGLAEVRNVPFQYQPDLDDEMLTDDEGNLSSARLLDPTVVKPTIQDLQVGREYYRFVDVDVDRYQIGGERTPVVVSARELNLAGVSNRTWEKSHLVFTHGYAAALAPANVVNSRGEPRFMVSGIPVQTVELPKVDRPELYIGEDMDGYAIVGTKMQELSSDDLTTTYQGKGGVQLGSTLRRAAFALRFGEIEPLISGNITNRSKVIYVRDVVDRVSQIVPYLRADPDPYPVILDGRVQYVVDLYTTSSSYPYGQNIDAATVAPGARGSFNYIRNSAKAVVDAYDGSVEIYLSDTLYGARDPMIRAYAKAFPGLFSEDIPADLMAHFRYPEFLFKVQTEAWGRYHQTDPSTFFNNSDRWVVAPQPSSTGAGSTRTEDDAGTGVAGATEPMEPYYQELRIGSADGSQFVLTRPFVLTSGDGVGRNLTSVMVARMDPENFGHLEQITMVTREGDKTIRNDAVDGPGLANRKMLTYGPVTQFQTLTGQQGSRIQYGNILILPIGDALMYLRPVYVAQEGSSRFTLKKVVMLSGDAVGFGDTIDDALSDLLDSNPDGPATDGSGETHEPVDDDDTTSLPDTTGPDGETGIADGEGMSVEDLLAEADRKFTAADERLRDADLAGYSKLVDEARALMSRAQEALNKG